MKLPKRIILLLTTAWLFAPVYAGNIDVKKLQNLADSYLQMHRYDEHVSALALTVISPGLKQPVSVYAGSRIFEGQLPVNNNSLFQIGSITKSYVTAIVLQLESDPKNHFSIDDPIDAFFPEYTKWHGVTLRQLMNMTSGIPSYTLDEEFFASYMASPYLELSPLDLISYVYKQDMLFTPGTKWNYSNTNYTLLGLLIEKLTGNSLDDEINRRLIKPLSLNHTYYAPYKPSQILLRDLVHGYAFHLANEDPGIPLGLDVTDYSLSWGGAAGAIISSSTDVAAWVQALFTPGKVLSKEQFTKLTQLVSTASGQPLSTPTQADKFGFGMGIGYGYFYGIDKLVYSYEGMTLAGRAVYIYEPISGVIIAATLNSSVNVEHDHYRDLIAKVYRLLKE